MKKLVIALLLILNTGVCFGASSEDMSVYLRKDVFDAKMDEFMKEIRGEFQVVNTKIDALSRRIDDKYLLMVVLGIIISLPIVQKMLQSREERRASHGHTVTLEDVKRLIAENNAELMKNVFTRTN